MRRSVILPPEELAQLVRYLRAKLHDGTADTSVIEGAFMRAIALAYDWAADELTQNPYDLPMVPAASTLRRWAEETRSLYR